MSNRQRNANLPIGIPLFLSLLVTTQPQAMIVHRSTIGMLL